MDAGELRHRIEIQEPTGTTGKALNNPKEAWKTFAKRWAKVEPLSGTEGVTADQQSADVTYEVTIRGGGPAITPQHQIVWKGKTLSIESVIDKLGRGIWTIIRCVEQVAV